MAALEHSTFFCPTRIHLGAGSHRKLGDILRAEGCQRLFVVIDGALLNGEFYAGIRAMLEGLGVAIASYSDIEPDPLDTTVLSAAAACAAHGATALLAIGGGSAMDVAKAVGILATNGGRIHDYEGIEKFSTPPLPLIAIPTTAGTGSEVSGSCVITDSVTSLKMSIRHAALNPARHAILDPLALRTLPGHVAAHSGMDAFVHAFESYISRQANLVTDAINIEAIRLLAANIRPFVANRENLDAGLNMLVGSALAGITFGQTGLGNVHCLARFVGAYWHLSHGLSNAVCLPHVARFNMLANPDKFGRIAMAMDWPLGGSTQMEAAQAAVDAIEALCRDLAIPARLRDVGAEQEKFDEIAERCVQANYNRWNPRTTTKEDFRQLLAQAF